MADDGRTTLGELPTGTVFRDEGGRLWWANGPGVTPERSWALPVGRDEDADEFPADTPVEPLDLPALLAELDELRTLTHDLLIDRDASVGREVGRGEALAVLGEVAEEVRRRELASLHTPASSALATAEGALRDLGPVRPLPPPERVAERCRALEEALRACVEQMEMVAHHPPDFAAAVERGRKLLGGGVPPGG
jgi:hypothetical protein